MNGFCEDCISRKDFLDICKKYCDANCAYSENQRAFMCKACMMGDAIVVAESMPSVLTKADSSVLEDIKAEIEKIYNRENNTFDCLNALDELKNFIDKHMESEDNNAESLYSNN